MNISTLFVIGQSVERESDQFVGSFISNTFKFVDASIQKKKYINNGSENSVT